MTGKIILPMGWPSELNFLSEFSCAAALKEIFVLRFIYVPKTDMLNNIHVGYRAQEKNSRTNKEMLFFPCAQSS
jgi:hypothetical protein